jgi:hypothetical protein
MKNIITLLIVFSFLFFAYRSCTKGYDAYAFFVHVKDVTVFMSRLSPADTRIIDRGRRLKNDIILMDNEIDNGDGAHKGAFRWYGCSGIDCDEGWESSFLVEK